ncbi:hypothetical protein AABB02_01250 [Streptomyces rimosus]|uniref:hypothetical protein n=1 Tax=Streptomyces rimosus TaxID=1927 RepID=UPI0031DD17B4
MGSPTAIPAPAAAHAPAAAVVRTPDETLHLLPEGCCRPRLPLFTVTLLCSPDAAAAPATRPYNGPWTELRACRVCLRVWRGEPPLAAQPAPAAALLPGTEPVQPRLRRTPTLPDQDRGRPVDWKAWKPRLRLTHAVGL